MPIKIPHELPAYKKLQDENLFHAKMRKYAGDC